MRIIFVGLHNKPDRKPLDILTKSGKLINRVIKELPKDIEIVKTNLFDIEKMPNPEEVIYLQNDWFWSTIPVYDDIIVLLGAYTHKTFKFDELNIVKIAHPASMWSHLQMDNYILNTTIKILDMIEKINDIEGVDEAIIEDDIMGLRDNLKEKADEI